MVDMQKVCKITAWEVCLGVAKVTVSLDPWTRDPDLRQRRWFFMSRFSQQRLPALSYRHYKLCGLKRKQHAKVHGGEIPVTKYRGKKCTFFHVPFSIYHQWQHSRIDGLTQAILQVWLFLPYHSSSCAVVLGFLTGNSWRQRSNGRFDLEIF